MSKAYKKATKETKETKEKKINKELYFGENEIKNNIRKSNLNPIFKKYGLLNKDWLEEYKSTLFGKKLNNNIFQFEKISPNFDKKFTQIDKKLYSLSVPNNFVVVTEYLIKLISENFDDENKDKRQELLFDAIIGGECIIFKNSKNDNIHFISLYGQNNNIYNYNKNVDFIFIYFNKDEIEKRINFIMENTISNFFVSNGINKENKNVQMIKDNENKLIAQIISNKYFNPSETFYMLYNENMLNLANPNTYNIYKLKPILICLYQFKNLMEELDKYSNNKNIITKLFVEFLHNFNNIDEITIKFQNHFKDILEKQNYKDIISEIIDKLNLELSDNKKNINKQIEEITEEAAKEKFIKEHQNPSIIEKIFFIQILREKIEII